MNILVTGSNGQLGTHMRLLAPQSKHTWLMTDVAELDITSQEAVASYVNDHDIRLIVNCAGYTNVDRAESDEETAKSINADAVAIMAQAMKEVDGTLIHISTDYVFGGNKNNTPCSEEEPVNPTGAYGRTKLAGERAAEACRHIIFRTSWLYSEYGKNFLLTMLNLTATRPELNVVFDQVGTPTYAGDLARAIFDIIDFTKEIARQSGHTDCNIMPCHSDEFPSPVKRPAYSVLDKTKYKQTFHRIVPYWTESLTTCIDNINKNR